MRRRERVPRAAAVPLLALVLAGCGAGAAATAPTWQPKQDAPFAAEPGVPTGGPSAPAAPTPGTTPTPGATTTGPDPAVLATDLITPTGLAVLPDGTALVGERTTGQVRSVQPEAGQPTPVVQTLTGLDAGGDGGLMDLTASPTYAEDGLVYAYVTTAADNEVVTFTVGGPVTPVVTGIPKGSTGNVGRIAFDATGDLLVATGTAGLAPDPASLAGKVLRYDDVGRPAPGNPAAGSPIWASGLSGAEGLCPAADVGDDVVSAVLVGSAADGAVRVAAAGRTLSSPLTTLPTGYAGLGGCGVFGSRLFVSSLDGQALLGATLTSSNGSLQAAAPVPVLTKTYGRLRTVVAASDGSVWLTTSNRDGSGTPGADDDRVVRITPAGGDGGDDKA